MQKVLGILAGTDITADRLLVWAQSADVVLAADGAANRLLEVGFKPDRIIGDMDSLEPLAAQADLNLQTDLDQETTDCDKLLTFAKSHYPDASFSLIGMEGDRFDHVLTSLHSVGRLYPEARLILRDGFAWHVEPGKPVLLVTNPGQTVSLIPIQTCEGVVMQGVQWPPSPVLSPMGFTSISNIAVESTVSASIESGVALLVLQASIAQPDWP